MTSVQTFKKCLCSCRPKGQFCTWCVSCQDTHASSSATFYSEILSFIYVCACLSALYTRNSFDFSRYPCKFSLKNVKSSNVNEKTSDVAVLFMELKLSLKFLFTFYLLCTLGERAVNKDSNWLSLANECESYIILSSVDNRLLLSLNFLFEKWIDCPQLKQLYN